MKLMALIATTFFLNIYFPTALSATHSSTVVQLQTGLDNCAYFRLDGVTQTDPIGHAHWFAIPLEHDGAKQMLAVLLAARVSNLSITAVTSGNLVCGGGIYAEVSFVTL